MHYLTKTFDELSSAELYALLQLRNEVFIVEQNCPYPDLDDKDQASLHVLGYLDGKLAAYTRLLPQGLSYAAASIGRVCTKQELRHLKLGRNLMVYSIAQCLERFGADEIVISAQEYLERFYTSLGFVKESDSYMEDGIPHIKMRYKRVF